MPDDCLGGLKITNGPSRLAQSDSWWPHDSESDSSFETSRLLPWFSHDDSIISIGIIIAIVFVNVLLLLILHWHHYCHCFC